MKKKTFGWGLCLYLGLASAGLGNGDEALKKAISDGWKKWIELQADLHSLGLILGAGYAGDSSSDKELDKLDLGAGIFKNGYPNALSFDLALNIQLKRTRTKADFVENVSTLRIDYERYFLPFFKAYGFAERFSDTYLSIQQRYETGLGIKFETEIGLTPAGRKRDREVEEFQRAVSEGRAQNLTIGEDSASALALEGTQFRETLTALRKKYAVLSLGLACTVLTEIDRAEIEVEDGSTALLDPERRIRVAVRPGLTFRPAEGVFFKWQTYFKLPAFDRIHQDAFDGRRLYDLRTDTYVTLRYDLSHSPAWAKKVFLSAEYKNFHDRIPPFIPGVKAAASNHSTFILKIGAEL